jgi:asparagine synthase (glutamine-hydrolysing)
MCGIFGLVGKRSAEINRALTQGTRALAHRGPDDEGTELLALASDPNTCVGLGARRLAILDLSPAGHQPMHDPATGNWLIFNGEIYNFREIRLELQKLGHPFASTGDTEVLLRAYGQWGEACLQRLVGMFAFAVWDSHNQRLFLARDRLGEKPLYYSAGPGLFIFGSEVRSLLATGLVPRHLDTAGLASYLAFGAVQDPLTIMEGVRSLPPGHSLTWEKGQCRAQRYWSLAEVASRPPATSSPEEAVKSIRQHLLEAVSQRLVSDVPLGIFLSGGVDSSSVVAAACEVSAKPIEAFSVVFGGSSFCEATYSDQVARKFGCHHHKIELTETQLLEEIPESLSSMDQPTVDGVNTYVVSQATKKAGITVALSGLGGDELFGGYSSFVSVPRMVRFRRYAGWLEPLGRGVNALIDRKQTNRPAKIRALAAGDYYTDHPYFLSRALFLPRSVRALFPSLALQNGNLAAAWNLRGVADSVRDFDPVNQVAVLESSTYMANTLLRDTDCMSMAHALEVRTPLLHHPLWEFVLPLAGRLKLAPPLPKPLLLRAVGQRLPEEIYLRRKMGFTLPFELWMHNGLRSVVERELLDPSAQERIPLDPRQVANIWKAFLVGKTSWSRPWALFVLKHWIRRNIFD